MDGEIRLEMIIDELEEQVAFLEDLLETLYGEGWDELTIADAKRCIVLKNA